MVCARDAVVRPASRPCAAQVGLLVPARRGAPDHADGRPHAHPARRPHHLRPQGRRLADRRPRRVRRRGRAGPARPGRRGRRHHGRRRRAGRPACPTPSRSPTSCRSSSPRRLGLAPSTPWHTSRASVTRLGDASVRCTDAWGRIAGDVLVLGRPEIGELSEGAGGGSSTMPHKSNPVLSTLVRRAALTTPQLAATLHLAAAEATDERSSGPWHAEWATLRTLLRRAVVAGDQATDLLGRPARARRPDGPHPGRGPRRRPRRAAQPGRPGRARRRASDYLGATARVRRGPPGPGRRRAGRPRLRPHDPRRPRDPEHHRRAPDRRPAPRRAPAPRARPVARHVRDDALVAVRGRAHRRLRRARLGPPGPRPQPGRARRALHHGRAGRGRAAGRRRRARRARRDRGPRSSTRATPSAAPWACSCCVDRPDRVAAAALLCTGARIGDEAMWTEPDRPGQHVRHPGDGVRVGRALVRSRLPRAEPRAWVPRCCTPCRRPTTRATPRSAPPSPPSTCATGSPRSAYPVLAVAGSPRRGDAARTCSARSPTASATGVRRARRRRAPGARRGARDRWPACSDSTSSARSRPTPRRPHRPRGPRRRHGRTPRGARRRPRRPGHRRRHRPHPGVPGVHHRVRMGRHLDPPRPRPAQPLADHAHRPDRPRPPRGARDARAGRPHQRPHGRRDQGARSCRPRSTAASRTPTPPSASPSRRWPTTAPD